jgi:hypothetical protein
MGQAVVVSFSRAAETMQSPDLRRSHAGTPGKLDDETCRAVFTSEGLGHAF